jgi:hypothetical protein
LIEALRMPATSPSVCSSSSVFQPLRSQYLRYWRRSMLAQSQASVPPAPAWMSMKQLLGSAGLANMRREFEVGDELLHRVKVGLDRLQRGFVVLFARHLEKLAGVDQRGADAGQRADHGFEGFLFLAQGLGALRVVPELGVFEDLA